MLNLEMPKRLFYFNQKIHLQSCLVSDLQRVWLMVCDLSKSTLYHILVLSTVIAQCPNNCKAFSLYCTITRCWRSNKTKACQNNMWSSLTIPWHIGVTRIMVLQNKITNISVVNQSCCREVGLPKSKIFTPLDMEATIASFDL